MRDSKARRGKRARRAERGTRFKTKKKLVKVGSEHGAIREARGKRYDQKKKTGA